MLSPSVYIWYKCGVTLLCVRYGKAFETEPTLHSGINNVVLLMAAGHEFETSIELRKIGASCFQIQRYKLYTAYTLQKETGTFLLFFPLNCRNTQAFCFVGLS